jgi:hypothetical protein
MAIVILSFPPVTLAAEAQCTEGVGEEEIQLFID